MSDENLIERLRYNQVKYDNVGLAYAESRNPDGEEAAAAIERLTVERDAARAELAATRDKAIEECAAICGARYMGDNNREDREALACAAAIRALKGNE